MTAASPMPPVDRTLAIVQARMSSTRLPGKSLLPLGRASVLEHVVERLKSVASDVVVATSTDHTDDPIASHCRSLDVDVLRGPLDNVFARFRQALDEVDIEPEWFIRVTADCPLVSSRLARQLLEARRRGVDHVGMSASTILGLPVEVVRTASFRAIDASTLSSSEREHVTSALYQRPRFVSLRVDAPIDLQDDCMCLTLDYPEDYGLLSIVFHELDEPTAEAAVALVRSDRRLMDLAAKAMARRQ